MRPDESLLRPADVRAAPSGECAAAAWLDRALRWRDHALASPRFQRWAAGFPLTRPIARRRARALFDLCAGFVYSQVLLACVELRLFESLAEGPQTLAELAQRLRLSPEAATRLLGAAVSLRLAERRRGHRFGLGSLGAALLGNSGVAAMIEHHRLFYADVADPVGLLRGDRETQLGRYWGYAGNKDPTRLKSSQTVPYTALMAASQALIAQDILDAYPVHKHRLLLDLGGGDGTFAVAAAARAPLLQVMLFDLPSVAEQAKRRFAGAGLSNRARTIGGNFRSDPLPPGADLISLIRVVHDHDEAAALALLRAVRLALAPDGVVLIAESMTETRGAEPVADAYFAIYLLAMGSGRPRAPRELCSLLTAAGFRHCRSIATRSPLLTQLIIGRR